MFSQHTDIAAAHFVQTQSFSSCLFKRPPPVGAVYCDQATAKRVDVMPLMITGFQSGEASRAAENTDVALGIMESVKSENHSSFSTWQYLQQNSWLVWVKL